MSRGSWGGLTKEVEIRAAWTTLFVVKHVWTFGRALVGVVGIVGVAAGCAAPVEKRPPPAMEPAFVPSATSEPQDEPPPDVPSPDGGGHGATGSGPTKIGGSAPDVAPQAPAVGDAGAPPPGAATVLPAPGKAPQVVLGAPSIQGALPEVTVVRIVRQRISQLRTCYDVGLKTDKALQGNVTIGFVVTRAGKVRGAQVASKTVTNGAVAACMMHQFALLTFPKPTGGEVTISYPIDVVPPAKH